MNFHLSDKRKIGKVCRDHQPKCLLKFHTLNLKETLN